MSKEELFKKLASLETLNDQLITELAQVDHLMRQVGFSDGVATVKATAQECCEQDFDEEMF